MSVNIEVPKINIVKWDYDAKLELTEKERQELRKSIRDEFRKRIEELEANILAYQDLLITKEEEISILSSTLSQFNGDNISDEMKE